MQIFGGFGGGLAVERRLLIGQENLLPRLPLKSKIITYQTTMIYSHLADEHVDKAVEI